MLTTTNSFISKEIINEMKKTLEQLVIKQFQKHYSLNSISTGKNLLTFEIAIQFLTNLLNYEISELEKGKKIKIIAIEKEVSLQYNIKEIDIPILLTGHIDRIDEVDGVLRIVDYKTGKVKKGDYTQINYYEKVLVEMGYIVQNKIIVNTLNNVEVIIF